MSAWQRIPAQGETKSIGYVMDQSETKSIGYFMDQGETKSIGYSRDQGETKRKRERREPHRNRAYSRLERAIWVCSPKRGVTWSAACSFTSQTQLGQYGRRICARGGTKHDGRATPGGR
eukprot:5407935-Prymnesium_polylepis.1